MSKDWTYKGAELELAWRKRAGNWQILVPYLSLWQDAFSLEAELVLNLDDRPNMDLVAELAWVVMQNAEQFFPKFYMPESVIKYLNLRCYPVMSVQAKCCGQVTFLLTLMPKKTVYFRRWPM